MIANSLMVTSVLFLALAFWVMQEATFLVPYRRLVFQKYGDVLLVFAAVLFLNLFAAIYAAWRRLFLKDTGRKLAHLEKQLRTGASISEELSQLLKG
jgi:Gpi18-like mannosyltransferase